MANPDGAPDPRYYSIMQGFVVDNVDPRAWGRVRVTVPGLFGSDGSPWAFPAGFPGAGNSQRGQWDVPDKDSEVYVFFLGGDPDKIRYFCGHWADRTQPDGSVGTEVPTPVRDAVGEDGVEAATKVKCWETDRFLLVFDGRSGKERMYMLDKTRGEDAANGLATMIEFDAATGGIIVSGTVAVLVRSKGIIDIQGLVVQINGRKVLNVDKPI